MGAQRFGVVYGYLAPRKDGGYILAADHDRIVAEAEARGWNAAVCEVETILVSAVGAYTLRPREVAARELIAALRKPEVEG